MYEISPESFSAAISNAVVNRDSTMLETEVQQFAEFCFKEQQSQQDTFAEVAFSQILALIPRNEFLSMAGSHKLLLIFEYDWARLDSSQKERLLESLSQYYDKFADWMSYFVISELLGEYYCNEASFSVLVKLQHTPNEIARALVPHGFEHIARESKNDDLRKRALFSLNLMKDDESAQVREEAAQALAKLQI